MRRSAFACGKHTPLSIKPAFSQVSEYSSSVLVSKQTWDVLQIRVSRSYCAKDGKCFGPHVSAVVSSRLFPGNGEGLTGESACNDINHSLIAFGVPFTEECSDIAEYWRVVEDAIVDSGPDDPLTVLTELDISTVFPP
jgi:hypothetical protein